MAGPNDGCMPSPLFPCPCISVSSEEAKANYKSNEIQNYLRWRWMTVTRPTLFPVQWTEQSTGGDAFNSLTSLLFGLFSWSQVQPTAREIGKELLGEQVEIQVLFFSLIPLFFTFLLKLPQLFWFLSLLPTLQL